MNFNPRKQGEDAPPKWADKLLEWFFDGYQVEEIQGDLYEVFARRMNEIGLKKARRMYWIDVLRFLHPLSKKRKITPLYHSPVSLPSQIYYATKLLAHCL